MLQSDSESKSDFALLEDEFVVLERELPQQI